MSLAFTVIRCDGPNGIEGRRCAALLTLSGAEPVQTGLARMGWWTNRVGEVISHSCPGCSPKAKPIEAVADPGTPEMLT